MSPSRIAVEFRRENGIMPRRRASIETQVHLENLSLMPSHLDTGVGKREVSNATPGLASVRIAFTEIPVIDFSAMYTDDRDAKALVAQEVHRACIDVGFFYVQGHGVQPDLIERLLGVSREFFAQDTAEKKRIDVSKS